MRIQQELFQLIHSVTGQRRLLTVPRPLAGFMGSLEGGLFLSQLLYWSDRSTGPGSEQGWFYKSYPDWEAETLLSEYKVRKYTRICQERGFLQVDVRPVRGVAVTHYRLRLGRLQQQLVAYLRGAQPADLPDHHTQSHHTRTHHDDYAKDAPAAAHNGAGDLPEKSANDSPKNSAAPPEDLPPSAKNSPGPPQKIAGRPPRKSGPPPQNIRPPSLTESTSQTTAYKTAQSRAGPLPPFTVGDWRAVLDELRSQLPAATFEQALHRCRFLRRDDDLVLLRARSPYAADWINHRLRPAVERTLNGWLRAGGTPGRPLRIHALPPGGSAPSAEKPVSSEKPGF